MGEPDIIEVKFAVAPEHTAKARKLFRDEDDDLEERAIVFFDTADLAFFARQIILRVRRGPESDATFKIRGPQAPAAAERFDGELDDALTKFEGDQNVGREILPSFSVRRVFERYVIDAVLRGAEPPSSLFGEELDIYLHDLDRLDVHAFGPIASETWKKKIKGSGLGRLTMERWESDTLSLVEISEKVAREEAADFGAKLDAALAELGIAQLPGSKTERALRGVPSSSFVGASSG